MQKKYFTRTIHGGHSNWVTFVGVPNCWSFLRYWGGKTCFPFLKRGIGAKIGNLGSWQIVLHWCPQPFNVIPQRSSHLEHSPNKK